MSYLKAPPFTQDGSSLETPECEGLLNQAENQEGISSSAERSLHTREVAGAAPASPTKPGPDPAPTDPSLFEPIDTAKFWTSIRGAGDHDCWDWDARSNPKGYGRFRGEMAHRIAYELIKGDIPAGLIVRHRCDNPKCCNPNHLDTGTHIDNMRDAVERGRIAKGERHGKSKLTADNVAYIRANPDRLTGRALAAMFGAASSTISYIRHGRSWKP